MSRAYRPSSSNWGLLIVLLCVVGSVGVHSAAYAVLRHIRKPEVKERPGDEIIQERKRQVQRRKTRKVRLLKPRIPPRRAVMAPPKPVAVRRVRLERQPPMAPPMAAMEPPREAPMAPLDLTPMGAGVDPSLTATNGEGIVAVGSTADGDPTVAPMRARPRPRPRPVAPVVVPPRPRPRPVVLKQMPAPVHVPQVAYPRAAKRANIEGTVKLEVTVGKDGRVIRVRVIKRLGYGLDEAAVRALKRARFRPAMGSDGKPMEYSVIYKYTFRLEQ